jgi:pantothenate kinase
MTSELETQIQSLERRAKAVHDNLLQFASRAFVIEFAGTPKSGKSTSVEAIRHFFSRQDFQLEFALK